MEKKNKVAIVIGHTNLRKGACSEVVECEFNYNRKVAQCLSDVCDIYYYDSYNLGYKSMVKRNAKKMNKNDYDLVLELHYNSAVPQANGCEVFYYFNNSEGKKLAGELSEMISQTFDVKDRGAKAMVSKRQRGFWALYYPIATTLLLEPFFGSNTEDATKFKDDEEYSRMIRKFLKQKNYI